MKNLFAILLILTGTSFISAQTTIFNKFEELNEVTSVVVTQEAFN